MKFLIMSLVMASSISVFAKVTAAPKVETLESAVLSEVIDVMALAKSSDLQAFLKSGNVTKSISKVVSGNLTTYSMTRQHCFTNGTSPAQCLGGAQLEVQVRSEIQMSNLIKTGESRVLLIK